MCQLSNSGWIHETFLFCQLNYPMLSNMNTFRIIVRRPGMHCIYQVTSSVTANYRTTLLRMIDAVWDVLPQIAMFMRPQWGPPGSCRHQMGPMFAPWTLLSGTIYQGICYMEEYVTDTELYYLFLVINCNSNQFVIGFSLILIIFVASIKPFAMQNI